MPSVRKFRVEQFHANHDQSTHGNRGGARGFDRRDGSGGETVGDSGASNAAQRSLGENVPLPSRAALEAGFDPVPDTPQVESTLLNHLGPDGQLTRERKQVHDELIAEALVQPELLPNKEPNPKAGEEFPSQDNPKAVVMGGGAAAGKSSSIAAGYVDVPEDAVTINPDEFKIELPESAGPSKDGKQGNGLADEYGPAWASITHEESSHLGKRLTTAAIDRKTNILVDKTSSDGPKAVAEIERLQKAGYDVEVSYVTTDIDQAVAGALKRQETTGRAVPEEVLRKGHEGANAAFLDVAAQSTAPAKLVTTIAPAPDGTKYPPVLTASSDGSGNLTIHNAAAWEAYLGRVPSVPEALKIREEALVASSGTLSPVIREDRLKVLYGHAMAGTRPAKLTAEEEASLDRITTQIAEMRENGIAFDFPINDIFADEGIVAVRTPRAFKSEESS